MGKPIERYVSQHELIAAVKEEAEARQISVENELREAFGKFLCRKQVDVIMFADVSPADLAAAIKDHPVVLKSLLAACNLAARAVERDLDIKNLDTYEPRLLENEIQALAGYIKAFLPPAMEVPALGQIDRIAYIDKEIRKGKGRWEFTITSTLNRCARTSRFRKRQFEYEGESFELDAATPEEGPVRVGIDVKRIEARRDIHKRCDEIVNKAAKLKSAFPEARFGAVVYYPFMDEHINVVNRLRAAAVDKVVFASEEPGSIESAAKMLLSSLGIAIR